MKKVLFATTALVATTGMAAAEISFGGFGRFGLIYVEDQAGGDDVRVEQRFRLTATGQTTSDNGLEFEGRIRFESNDNGDSTGSVASNSAAGFAVSTGGFRLDVGNVSNVIDSQDVVNYYGFGIGLTDSNNQQSAFDLPAVGFGSGKDDVSPTIKLKYTVGAFTVSASVTDDLDTDSTTTSTALTASAPATLPLTAPLDQSTTTTVATNTDKDTSYQIGVGYTFGNYKAGFIYGEGDTTTTEITTTTNTNLANGAVTSAVSGTSSNDSDDFWAASLSGENGQIGWNLLIGEKDGGSFSFGASAKYDIGAVTSVSAAFSTGGASGNDEVYGVGFKHGLGGGVSLAGGISQDTSSDIVVDLGVQFNF